MRQLGHGQSIFYILMLVENPDYAAIIGLEELAKYKDGKNLSLCEIVPAAKIGIRWQNFLGGFQCQFCQNHGRFGHSRTFCHGGILSNMDCILPVYDWLST